MTGFDVTACAEDFWKAVGEPEAYPRSLERSICRAFAVFIVKVPNLDVQAVNEHLKQRRLPWEMDVAPRRLRACLLARAGMGWVFLDGADPPDQMRFSLAHEMAHFLLDHLAPRRLALATLGNSILDVLDGRRQPAFLTLWNATQPVPSRTWKPWMPKTEPTCWPWNFWLRWPAFALRWPPRDIAGRTSRPVKLPPFSFPNSAFPPRLPLLTPVTYWPGTRRRSLFVNG